MHPSRSRLALAAILAAVSLLLLAACSSADGRQDAPRPPAAVVDLDRLPPDIAELYRFVEAKSDVARRIPCYCGCGETLAHRSLLDCFLTEDGAYEPHATGCTVCQDEARIVRDRLATGADAAAIRAEIDLQYRGVGPPTDTP